MSKILMQDNVAAPEAPSAGKHVLFSKADGFYVRNADGSEVRIGPALGLREVDGVPSLPTMDTLEVNQLDGLRATNPSGKVGRIGLDAFVGDSGAGGVKGAVPAPAPGDAIEGKVLGAGGGWVLTGGGVTDMDTCNGRLSFISGQPMMFSQVAGAQSLYFEPLGGDRISLFDGVKWERSQFAEISFKLTGSQNGITTNGSPVITGLTDTSKLVVGELISGTGIPAGALISTVDTPTQVTLSANATATNTVSLTFKLPANKRYDVFAYSDGEVKLTVVPWTNLTSRATNLVQLNGVYVLSGMPSFRFLGTFQTNGTDGTADHNASAPLLINASDYMNSPLYEIPVVIGSRTNLIVVGWVGTVRVPYRMKLIDWVLTGDTTGSIQVDVTKANYAGFPTTTSIITSGFPALSSAAKALGNCSGWNQILEPGDILSFYVQTASSLKQVELVITAQKLIC